MPDVLINSDLSEIISYNNPLFPAFAKPTNLSSYPNYRATCHWHNDLEFIYVMEGKMNYSVNGSIIPLTKGQGIFVNSRCLHYGFSDNKEECAFLGVLLHPDLLSSNKYFLENTLLPFFQNDSIPYISLDPSIKWQNKILSMVNNIYASLDKKNEALEIIQNFTNILYLIITNTHKVNPVKPNQHDLDTITSMVGYVQHHYTEKITIGDLMRSGGCCKTKCTNLFREYLNSSPIMYVINYRLDKSIELLTSTNSSITDIAYQCGFSCASYYCETFYKYYGLSPKQYRKTSIA